MATGWEHFPHGADMGVRGFGPTEEAAFEQTALALTALVTPPDTVRPDERVQVRCMAGDRDVLLMDFLNAVILEMSARNLVFGQFEVHLDGPVLRAVCAGETMNPSRHELAVEPKGATFTELQFLRRTDGTWQGQCVVDV